MTYLEIKDISFRYNPKFEPAIQNTTLAFSQGEQIAIIGENGAGKTTLAKLMIGMLKPQNGLISIEGRLCFSKSKCYVIYEYSKTRIRIEFVAIRLFKGRKTKENKRGFRFL